jgi:polyisoprenoid-binding protein YceI
MRFNQVFLSAALVLASVASHAADYTVDPAHSSVNFTIRHLVSKVTGSFNEFSGEFSYDEKKPESSKGMMTIQTKSINTNNAKRDDHLRSADFFDAEKNPTITFKSTKVTPSGKGKFKLLGDMTMHGVTKPVTWDVEYMGTAKDPQGTTRAGFSAHTKIARKDFGIVWNKTLDSGGVMLGEDVELNVQIEAPQKGTEAKK